MTYVKPVTYLYPKPVLPLNASICVPCPHVSHPSLYVTVALYLVTYATVLNEY